MTTTDAPPTVPADAPPAARPAWWRRLRGPLRHGLDVLVLLVVAVLVLAPGLRDLPVTDRDEARFAEASKQMVESGDWVDIRFQDEPRYKKPIGIYWLQGAAAVLSGEGADAPIAVYRLPSAIAAVLSVLLTYAIGVALGGANVGLLAGLLAAGTLVLGIEARIAKTDAVLLVTVLAAQWALASLWTDPARRRSLFRNAVFWTAIGLGVLVKGPVVVLVAGLTLAVLAVVERSWSLPKALSPLWGALWALVLVAPWLIAIGWISKGAFFAQSLGHDMLAKVAAGQESHGAPPGTHALVAMGTFWPLSALVPAALAWAIPRRSAKPVVFLAAWILPGWIVFEAIATKLPNYVLPFMPAFAVGTALAVVGGGLAAPALWKRATFGLVALGGLGLAIGLNAAFVVYEGRADPYGLAGGTLAGAAAVLATYALVRGRAVLGVLSAVAGAALLSASAFALLLPDARSLWLTDRLMDTVAAVKTCPDPVLVVVGYDEPSVVFRAGTGTVLAAPADGAARFKAETCAVLAVDDRKRAAVADALAVPPAPPPAPAATVTGRNFNGLRQRTLSVYVKP